MDDGRLRAWSAEKQAEIGQVTQEYEAGSISDADRDFYAIKDFSMELSEGIHGILGPNGAKVMFNL